MNTNTDLQSTATTLLLAVAIIAVVGVAFSGGAAALQLNTDDDGNAGNLTSGAADQAIGELQFAEQSNTVTSAAIKFPNGVSINQSTTSILALSSNMSSQSVSVQDSQTLLVSYDTAGAPAFLNITGVRVDVDPSVGQDTPTISSDDDIDLNVSGLTVGTNKTVNATRGQNGVGPQNVTLLPNVPTSGEYQVQGPDNKSLIGQGSTVTIGIPDNESRITFDTDATVTVSSNVSSNAVVDGAQASVSSSEISFTTTEGNLSVGEALNVSGIQYDTTGLADATVPADFTTDLTVETTAETPVSTRSQTASELDQFGGDQGTSAANIERPGTALNRTINVTSGQSNTTTFNVSIEDATTEGGALGANSQVVVSLPSGSGVTFNTSSSAPPTFAKFNSSNNQDRTDSGISVSSNTVTVGLNDSSTGVSPANLPVSLNITNLTVDSARGTTNQTINLTTTTTANKSANSITQNTSIGTTQLGSNQIVVANGNQVQGDVNASVNGFNYGSTGSVLASNTTGELRPGDTVTAAINVTDRFGGQPVGVTVDLNTTQNPSSSSILSTDSVTTNSTGQATFDVSLGDKTGTYNVTASLAHNNSANVTLQYKAEAGEAAGFTVTGVNNSVTDTSGLGAEARPLEQAAYRVQVVDANDNLVNASVDVNIETTADLENVTFNLSTAEGSPSGPRLTDSDNDGKRNYNATRFTNGNATEFFVFVSSSQPGDETVTISSEGTSATGTATVFSSTLDTVDVSVDKTNLTEGEEFNVTAAGKVDGTTVDVSGITSNFNINDSSVAFLTNGDATTDSTGQAVFGGQALTSGQAQINATLTADELSTSTTGSVTLGAQGSDGGEVPPDAVYEPDDPSAEFDADSSGTIDAGELNSAGTEFALGNLNASELNSIGTDFALS